MIPRHIAIVMDGNGRWAKQRLMPRAMGHRAGVKSVRRAIDFCHGHDIKILSLFTLSIENFISRPQKEVGFLVELLSEMLSKNLAELHDKGVQIRIAGDISVFSSAIQSQIKAAEMLTKNNTQLTLVLALNYSGRWDIVQAAQKIAACVQTRSLDVSSIDEKTFATFLSLQDLPEPDLFIRTSGEQRISNFFLWQLAYTELYFAEAYWPDFDETIFKAALAAFQARERRFGLTSEQLMQKDKK